MEKHDRWPAPCPLVGQLESFYRRSALHQTIMRCCVSNTRQACPIPPALAPDLELAPDLAVGEFAGQDVDVVGVGVLDNASSQRWPHRLAPV